ncbi:hypothetical protein D3C81_1670300 [compost metagenome]
MLACAPFHTCAACRQTPDLGSAPALLMMLLVFLREAEGGLFCYRPDSACPENIVRSEHGLGEIMGIRLIFPRKVKVDIGNLISLKPEERLKWNILPFPS